MTRRVRHPELPTRARVVAAWAAVLGPIVAEALGAAVIVYEVLTGVNNPAAFGTGLALAIGGKATDALLDFLGESVG